MGTCIRASDKSTWLQFTQWLNWDSRRRRWRPSTLPSMCTTSRETAMWTPSMPETSSVPATSTPHSRPSLRLEESPRRARRLKKAEVYPIYKAAKDSKDQGGFHDFVEILKLYDKNNDDTMMGHELFRLLTNLGEKLNKEEA